MRRTTLKDVAAHVGVSAKTVSNIVNGTGGFTDELRDRVRAAVVELGYRPNVAARQLRSGRSRMIAVAVPELSQPYFAGLASQLVRAAQERSATLLFSQTDGLVEQERLISDGVGIPTVAGIILSPLALTVRDLESRADDTPVVLLGEHIGQSTFPHVTVDNTAAARDAVTQLVQRGYTRIAAIGAQREGPNETAVLRLAGYRSALEAAGIVIDERLIQDVTDFHRSDGATAAAALLDSGVEFDAVFAFNDLLALGAMHALTTAGRLVPDDVAVIGFDAIDEGKYSTPTLSSVAPDIEALARTAIELILTDDPAPGIRTIEHAIVHRASTGGTP